MRSAQGGLVHSLLASDRVGQLKDPVGAPVAVLERP
jgi:hypothetical protein